VVLFDFGGTLDADGIHWAPRFYAAYAAVGGALAYPPFESTFKASDRELERSPEVRTIGFRALVDAQVAVLRSLLPDGGRLDARRMADLFQREALATAARNRPLLDRLARRYRLGVVSNFTGNLEPCLEELDLRACFSATVDSTLFGVAKPDPRIFRHALTKLGVAPGDAWMVGDNFETDIRPAAALGLRTCWLAPLERAVPGGAAPTVRISTLVDLEAALESDAAVVRA